MFNPNYINSQMANDYDVCVNKIIKFSLSPSGRVVVVRTRSISVSNRDRRCRLRCVRRRRAQRTHTQTYTYNVRQHRLSWVAFRCSAAIYHAPKFIPI